MGNMPHDEVTRIMNAMKAAGMNKKGALCRFRVQGTADIHKMD